MANKKKKAFLIISVIYCCDLPLSYTKTRTIYSADNRLKQTQKTIDSIRRYMDEAEIILVEAGKKDIGAEIKNIDYYYFLGNDKTIRDNIDSPFKGIGEAITILKIFDKLSKYDFVFKISGRYFLNEKFNFTKWDETRFNFKNYVRGNEICKTGIGNYIKGSHSTRLYGVPNRLFDKWKCTLSNSIKKMEKGKAGIETVICEDIKTEDFFYLEELGLEGNIAVDGNVICE